MFEDIQQRQLLSSTSMQKRFGVYKRTLKAIKRATEKNVPLVERGIFFSLWSLWSTTKTIKSTQLSARNIPEGVRAHFKRQKRIAVMVWADVTVVSDGLKSYLVFIEKGAKVNSKVYQ